MKLNAEVVEAIRQGRYRLRPVVQRRIARRDQERFKPMDKDMDLTM